MAGMEPDSVDAIVCDPPYDLTASVRGTTPGSVAASRDVFARVKAGGFMGREWDGTGVAFRPETWAAALRVAKPGAYLLAFGGTRTVHRMTCALEDAGWVIRSERDPATKCAVYWMEVGT
jgi:site-specific DNA-methyltransferase (adenine-specific)